MKSKSIIPRIQKPQFLITAHTNIKTKDLYEFSQVSRRIKNYFNKSFPHRKDPYSLLIVNETYPDGAFEKCFHLHIILGDFSTELYKSSKLVKDFSKSYPIPNSLDGIIQG